MMNRVSRMGVMLATLATLVLCTGDLQAQVNAESFAKLGFNFSPPGARSAALGGAFIPLADDATAAETNPAGLTVLLYPQASVEFKGIEYTRNLPREAGGGTGGTDFTDEVGFPSFASVVYPVRDFTFAAFYHELVNYQNTVWSSGFSGSGLLPFTSELDLSVRNFGGGFGLSLGSTLSVGVTGGISQGDMSVDFPRYRVNSFDPGFLENQLLVDYSGDGFFVNGGVLLRFGERFSLGGVYRIRPEFDDVEYRLLDADGSTIRTRNGTLKIPDSYGGGIALRATDLLTLTVDAVVNMYSQIPEEQVVIYNPGTESATNYEADDAVDIHGGAEYILFMGQTPLSLRAGVAQLGASNTYYTGTNTVERNLWGTEPGEDETLFTAGLGVVLARRIQLEGAGVFGDNRNEFVISAVYFFGRN